MLNFAEQTGSGVLILVWSYVLATAKNWLYKVSSLSCRLWKSFVRVPFLSLSAASQQTEHAKPGVDLINGDSKARISER